MRNSPVILTLVRHGETSANLEGVWHGSTDTALTERGQLQAARVAEFVRSQSWPIDAIYSSDLQRARHTAEAIGRLIGLTPILDSELREFDLGTWEGRTYHELYHSERLWDHMRSDPDFRPHGGESPAQVTQRLTGALRRIEADHEAGRVIVVGHGGALSMALGLLLDGDHTSWNRTMANCAVSELVLRPEVKLLSFNQTEHLAEV